MNDVEDLRRKGAALDYAAYSAEATDRVRFQINLVERGIQSLMYMNGGALVALFTLLGKDGEVFHNEKVLLGAFAFFAAGLVFVAVANLCAFLTQVYFAQVTQKQAWDAQRVMMGTATIEDITSPYAKGVRVQFAGVAAAVISLLAFMTGCGFAFLGAMPA